MPPCSSILTLILPSTVNYTNNFSIQLLPPPSIAQCSSYSPKHTNKQSCLPMHSLQQQWTYSHRKHAKSWQLMKTIKQKKKTLKHVVFTLVGWPTIRSHCVFLFQLLKLTFASRSGFLKNLMGPLISVPSFLLNHVTFCQIVNLVSTSTNLWFPSFLQKIQKSPI